MSCAVAAAVRRIDPSEVGVDARLLTIRSAAGRRG